MMSKTAVCVDCGQSDLRERMIRAPRGFVHTFTRNCQNTWQSNVEAAHNERDAAIARAEAAEKRVQELEAQLAVQAWRSVSEPPIEEGEYWGWDAHDGVFITHYNPDRDYDDDWAWSDWSGEMIPVDMWSPLIPPPPPVEFDGISPLAQWTLIPPDGE